MTGRVLIVAGSDSGGGAGIQADIKTVTALGGFAMTAITALTAQNTEGVSGIHDVPPAFVREQMVQVLRDLGTDCIKIGMLHRADVIDAVFETLDAEAPDVPLVLDPVMVAKGGHPLLTPDAVDHVRRRALPRARIATPNLPEAAVLAGEAPERHSEPSVELAQAVLALGPAAVLLKGGHGIGDRLTDLLVDRDGLTQCFESDRIATTSTHGTGCTLASAIATGVAQAMNVSDAVARAQRYVLEAIRTAPGLGRGHGPLNHGHTVTPFS